MKVAVLMACRDRAALTARALWLLDRQTATDYEVIVLDDGSREDLRSLTSGCVRRVRYIRTREPGAVERNPNLTWWSGWEATDAEFVILTMGEVMVPRHAISTMLLEHEPGRRSVPMMYCLGREQQAQIETVDWRERLTHLHKLPNFWNEKNPWGWSNRHASTYVHHLNFTGMTRPEWEFFGFLPKTEGRGTDEHWLNAREAETGHQARGIDLIVYHQHHSRSAFQDPDGSWAGGPESARLNRLRGG